MSTATTGNPIVYGFIPKNRFYRMEKPCPTMEVTKTHPLVVHSNRPVSLVEDNNRKPPRDENTSIVATGLDPLSLLAGVSPVQPATTPTSVATSTAAVRTESAITSTLCAQIEPWESRKSGILSKFSTSQKLVLSTVLPSGSDLMLKMTGGVETIRDRLEQLDDIAEGSVRETLTLTQQEYCSKIEEMNRRLSTAWNSDQRVLSLKIAIQFAKMLADTRVLKFYPSKFVLISDIMDNFASLVDGRLTEKSAQPSLAKETAKNWLYKVSSIREAIPRFYMETGLLCCYKFIGQDDTAAVIERLALTSRGFGDPLVACYGRCYLLRQTVKLGRTAVAAAQNCLDDTLFSLKVQSASDPVVHHLEEENISADLYHQLYGPALDWIVQTNIQLQGDHFFSRLLVHQADSLKLSLLLSSVLQSLSPRQVVIEALTFADLIQQSDGLGVSQTALYRLLGTCCVLDDWPLSDRRKLLNTIWRSISKLADPSDYMSCVEIWSEFVAKHFTSADVDRLLGDMVRRLTANSAYEQHYNELLAVFAKVLAFVTDFNVVLSMDNFYPFFNLLQKESVKVEASRIIVENYTKLTTSLNQPTTDPILIDSIKTFCVNMHDSLTAMSSTDERRIAGQLIGGFIRSVDFADDPERMLNFYTECRASFSGLDQVVTELVLLVNRLSIHAHRLVSKRTGSQRKSTKLNITDFTWACGAYCLITIPSLADVAVQFRLFIYSAQCSLVCGRYALSESLYRTAIGLILDYPTIVTVDGRQRSTSPLVVELFGYLCACLITLPDDPNMEPLGLVRYLLETIGQRFSQADLETDKSLLLCYIKALQLLAAMRQLRYATKVDGVEANDDLYGGDELFLTEVDNLSGVVLGFIDELIRRRLPVEGAAELAVDVQFVSEMALKAFEVAMCLGNERLLDDDNYPATKRLIKDMWLLSASGGRRLSAAFLRQRLHLFRTLQQRARTTGGPSQPTFLYFIDQLPLETKF